MKKIIFMFLKYLITFFILIGCFHGLLYLASSFPSDAIYANVLSSAKTLVEQGEIPKIGIMETTDNATDALIINEAYSIDSENPFESYMYARKNYKKGVTKIILDDSNGSLYSYANNQYDESGNPIRDTEYSNCLELYRFLQGDVTTSVNYSRYYHGYLVVFRPLLLLFDITGIRTFLIMIYLLLLIVFGYLLKKKFDTKTMIIFVYAFCMYGYFYAAFCLETSMLFLVLMISSILLLNRIETYTPEKLYFHLFITGAITNFLDYLTVPSLTLTIPLLIYMLYQRKQSSKTISTTQKVFKFIFIGGIFWSLGYALTWVSKWVTFDLVFHDGGIISAIQQILYRSYGDMPRVENTFSYSLGIHLFSFLSYIILFILPLLLSKRIQFKPFRLQNLKKEKDILLIALIPVAWYILLFNHSILHVLFTYRNMILPLIITLLILGNHFDTIEPTKGKFKKR